MLPLCRLKIQKVSFRTPTLRVRILSAEYMQRIPFEIEIGGVESLVVDLLV